MSIFFLDQLLRKFSSKFGFKKHLLIFLSKLFERLRTTILENLEQLVPEIPKIISLWSISYTDFKRYVAVSKQNI